jgi:hypothetical protein
VSRPGEESGLQEIAVTKVQNKYSIPIFLIIDSFSRLAISGRPHFARTVCYLRVVRVSRTYRELAAKPFSARASERDKAQE